MKMNIEDYLQSIDNSFKEKSQKDIYMTYAMIFSLIFAFSYLLFWDTSIDEFKTKKAQNDSLKEKIKVDEQYLLTNPVSKIAKLENDVKRASQELVINKDNNQYIKTKIETISALIYDERTWGEYLFSISKNAQKFDVKINNISNSYVDSNQSFGHILDIAIKSSSKYTNTIKFINSLEQSNLVVDIHDFNIRARDKLETDLNISVWGITY